MNYQKVMPEMVTLGLTPDHLNEEGIFRSFFMGKMDEKRIDAKNTILVSLMGNKISNGDYLKIPFRKFCGECSGKGFHILDKEYGIQNETCFYCQGTGVKTVPCKKCNNGVDENGHTCSTCKGRGKFRYYKNKYRDHSISCPKCDGNGSIEKTFFTGRILNWKTCGKCSGTSIDPNFLNKIENIAILNKKETPISIELAREEMEAVCRKYIS